MAGKWRPAKSGPYVEQWCISRDSSEVVWPEASKGHKRPGARALLANPVPAQRTLNAARISAYALSFAAGNGVLSWDMVTLDTAGRLVNSFHRLTAVDEVDARVPFWIYINAPENVVDFGDMGQVRSIAQTLKRHGYEDTTNLASASRFLYRWMTGALPGDRNKPVMWDGVEFTLRLHPNLPDYLNIGADIARGDPRQLDARKPGGYLHSRGLGTMLAYVFTLVDPVNAPEFIARWTFETGAVSDPVNRLRQWLLAEAASTPTGAKGSNIDVTVKAAVAIHAFNAQRQSETGSFVIKRLMSSTPLPYLPAIDWPADRELPTGETLERVRPFVNLPVEVEAT